MAENELRREVEFKDREIRRLESKRNAAVIALENVAEMLKLGQLTDARAYLDHVVPHLKREP